jgi:prepilin-type N-terminal cleavage/methylation domain-containing protein
MSQRKGFTVIELLVVVAIIATLSSIVLVSLQAARQSSYFSRAKQEFRSIETSLEMFASSNGGNYPPDADRDIPPGLETYLAPGLWPNAAWPDSVFDWDNWDDPVTGEKIYQISVRFCPVGQPAQCKFPKNDWAEDFDIDSAVYFCISGPCRSHVNKPVNHPGYCVNCGN